MTQLVVKIKNIHSRLMISVVFNKHEEYLGNLIAAAFKRSFGQSQVGFPSSSGDLHNVSVIVAINPVQSTIERIIPLAASGKVDKIVIFGTVPDSYLLELELERTKWPDQATGWFDINSASRNNFAETKGKIRYYSIEGLDSLDGCERALQRYDFLREWNNMGYGQITNDDSFWSLSMPAFSHSGNRLADIVVENRIMLAYAVILNRKRYSVMWFNRSTGPIDSFEWNLVEEFLSSYRHESLACHPAIEEIPWGFDACVTMRVDCDESIESCFELQREYSSISCPFSLAIRGDMLESRHLSRKAMKIIENAHALLSHSYSHPVDWGGTYEKAYQEATRSKSLLEDISGSAVEFAVSPFHQTPDYALNALEDAGYYGCIGGLSSCNPEFLLAKGGVVCGSNHFIGHSQQHMLHGDCLLSEDPLKTSKAAFRQASRSRQIFGYLDHPFSTRYSYGWESESKRIDTHMEFIGFIKAMYSNVLFLSEKEALGFIVLLSCIDVVESNNVYTVLRQENKILEISEALSPQVKYKGRSFHLGTSKWFYK